MHESGPRGLGRAGAPSSSCSRSSVGSSRERDASYCRRQVAQLALEDSRRRGRSRRARPRPDRRRAGRPGCRRAPGSRPAAPCSVNAAFCERWASTMPSTNSITKNGVPVTSAVAVSSTRSTVGGTGNGAAAQRRDDAVLAAHVVGAREHMAERRPAQHERDAGAVDAVGQVAAAAGDDGRRERAVGELGMTAGEPRGEAADIQPRHVRHRGHLPLGEPSSGRADQHTGGRYAPQGADGALRMPAAGARSPRARRPEPAWGAGVPASTKTCTKRPGRDRLRLARAQDAEAPRDARGAQSLHGDPDLERSGKDAESRYSHDDEAQTRSPAPAGSRPPWRIIQSLTAVSIAA